MGATTDSDHRTPEEIKKVREVCKNCTPRGSKESQTSKGQVIRGV